MIVKLQYPLSHPHTHVLAYNEDRSFIAEIPVTMFAGVNLAGYSMIPLMVHLEKLYVEATVDERKRLAITDLIIDELTW